jgi:hypothetical protein
MKYETQGVLSGGEPRAAADPGASAGLVDLAVKELVSDARRRFYQHQVQVGGPRKPSGKGKRWQEHVEEAEWSASFLAGEFRSQLWGLICRDEEVLLAALREAASWWSKASGVCPVKATPYFGARCADWAAVVLVARNLPQLRGACGDLVWDVLCQRVVERAVLTRLGEPVTEDRVRECIVVLLERADQFVYRTPAEAVEYFTAACRPRKKPEEVPAITASRVKISRHTLDRRSGETAAVHPASAPGPAASGRPVWERLAAILEPEAALRMWILGTLREDHGESWDMIAELVLEPSCRILSDDDLPPGASWDSVTLVFQAMARRSRTGSGTVRAAVLRQFYSRTRRKLGEVLSFY